MTSFYAHKGGLPQTGIPQDTATKITFPFTKWNDGGFYNTLTSEWGPPAGRHYVACHLGIDGSGPIIAGRAMHFWLFQDGVMFEALYIGRAVQTNASAYGTGYAEFETDGSHLYDLRMQVGAYSDPVRTFTNNGISRDHHWMGGPA